MNMKLWNFLKKYKNQLSIDDLYNVYQLLTYPINDEILENLDFLELENIKEQLIKAYIKNRDYLIKESDKIKNDPTFFDELYDNGYFIVFNIKSFEMDITDDNNVCRHGSPDEVLIFDIL